MATAPQPQLPLFYKDLLPLNSQLHGDWKVGTFNDATFFKDSHAIPLTVDEFIDAQRHYPIVFTSGDTPLPIALFGLNEGVNVFVGEDNMLEAGVYVPAYLQRYPFILARLNQGSEEMSLCFDPQSGVVGKDVDGRELFRAPTEEEKKEAADKGEPENLKASDFTAGMLDFCSRFEQSGQRTRAFLDVLKEHNLLREGRLDITRNDMPDRPFTYTGFLMVDEQKLRELPAKTLEELNKNGMLMLMHAQLFSMNQMKKLFERQSALGKVPMPDAGTQGAVPNGSM